MKKCDGCNNTASVFFYIYNNNNDGNQTLTAVINLVPWGWRSSSFWKIEGSAMEDGGVVEQRKEEDSLLL